MRFGHCFGLSCALGLVAFVGCSSSGNSPFRSKSSGGAAGMGGSAGAINDGSATGGSGGSTGGSAGASSGGSAGASSGGSAGASSGGSAGASSGGSAGASSGGSAGASSGGSGGSTGGTGGTGGNSSGGSGGSSGGSAGAGGVDGCAPATWCHDEDHDGYGNMDSSTWVKSCTSPGDHWIENTSASSCADCDDADANVHPGSNYCGATGYPVGNGGNVSFDYNCDGNEEECGNNQHATPPEGCVHASGSATCDGSGYLPSGRAVTSSSQDAYCGSTNYRICTLAAAGCTSTVVNNYNPITCK
jgi:hypothetical protein